MGMKRHSKRPNPVSTTLGKRNLIFLLLFIHLLIIRLLLFLKLLIFETFRLFTRREVYACVRKCPLSFDAVRIFSLPIPFHETPPLTPSRRSCFLSVNQTAGFLLIFCLFVFYLILFNSFFELSFFLFLILFIRLFIYILKFYSFFILAIYSLNVTRVVRTRRKYQINRYLNLG